MAGETNTQFRVAIVGAGIAGLALAMALHRKQVPYVIYEEALEYSAVGAGIGFAPNGMRAMDLIEPDFRPKYEAICVGNKFANAEHVFFEGMLLEEGLGQDQAWYGHSSWGHPHFSRKSAHRKALLDIMTSFIPSQHVKFNKRLLKIKQEASQVALTFSDGEVTRASILCGGDGIKSIVRQHVLGQDYPEQVAPVHAGAYCYRAVIPMVEAEKILGNLTDVAKFYFGRNRAAVTYRISEGKEFNYLLCVASDDPWKEHDAVTEKVAQETMMSDFEGAGVDDRFRLLLSKCSPVRWGLFHHPKTKTYFRNRVVLTGDSAHASLPFQAAGAAQALEDALVLSNVLEKLMRLDQGSGAYVHSALGAYDTVRRPRAQRQLEQSKEMQRMLFFQHEDAGDDMLKILPKLQKNHFEWLWFHDVEEDVRTALSMLEGR